MIGWRCWGLARPFGQHERDLDVLVCQRLGEQTGEEEAWEDEEAGLRTDLLLPLYFSGGFVEELSDARRYSLQDRLPSSHCPCEVKVVAKDPRHPADPLPSFPGPAAGREDPGTLLGGQPGPHPEMCFEIPPRWLDLTVVEVEEPRQAIWGPPTATVEELTEAFYYRLMEATSSRVKLPRPGRQRVRASQWYRSSRCTRRKASRYQENPSGQGVFCWDHSSPAVPSVWHRASLPVVGNLQFINMHTWYLLFHP